jgi:serine/threonine-protein kinase HipA
MALHEFPINYKRTEITCDDLLLLAECMNIKKANEIIAQVTDVIGNWPGYAAEVGIPKVQAEIIGKTHLIRI